MHRKPCILGGDRRTVSICRAEKRYAPVVSCALSALRPVERPPYCRPAQTVPARVGAERPRTLHAQTRAAPRTRPLRVGPGSRAGSAALGRGSRGRRPPGLPPGGRQGRTLARRPVRALTAPRARARAQACGGTSTTMPTVGTIHGTPCFGEATKKRARAQASGGTSTTTTRATTSPGRRAPAPTPRPPAPRHPSLSGAPPPAGAGPSPAAALGRRRSGGRIPSGVRHT